MASLNLDTRKSNADPRYATRISACEYINLSGTPDYVVVTLTTFRALGEVDDQLQVVMQPDQYNQFVAACHALPDTDHVDQWDQRMHDYAQREAH